MQAGSAGAEVQKWAELSGCSRGCLKSFSHRRAVSAVDAKQAALPSLWFDLKKLPHACLGPQPHPASLCQEVPLSDQTRSEKNVWRT